MMKHTSVPKLDEAFIKRLNQISRLAQTNVKQPISNHKKAFLLGTALATVLSWFVLMPVLMPQLSVPAPEISLFDDWMSTNESYVFAFVKEPSW